MRQRVFVIHACQHPAWTNGSRPHPFRQDMLLVHVGILRRFAVTT